LIAYLIDCNDMPFFSLSQKAFYTNLGAVFLGEIFIQITITHFLRKNALTNPEKVLKYK